MITSFKIFRKISIAIWIAPCLLASSCCIHHITYSNFKPKPKGTLRVVTYNLNFKKVKKNNVKMLPSINALKTTHADILILQEVTQHWRELLINSFKEIYHYRFFSKSGNGKGLGLGVLSNSPITQAHVLKAPVGRHKSILATISSPIGKLQVMNIHLQPPLNEHNSVGFLGAEIFRSQQTRLQEVKYLYSKLGKHKKTIIAGDYNENYPSKAIKFLYGHGFTDALWQDKTYSKTWCWHCLFFSFSKRLDHQMINSLLTPTQVQVLHEGASDHFPLVVDYRSSAVK